MNKFKLVSIFWESVKRQGKRLKHKLVEHLIPDRDFSSDFKLINSFRNLASVLWKNGKRERDKNNSLLRELLHSFGKFYHLLIISRQNQNPMNCLDAREPCSIGKVLLYWENPFRRDKIIYFICTALRWTEVDLTLILNRILGTYDSCLSISTLKTRKTCFKMALLILDSIIYFV